VVIITTCFVKAACSHLVTVIFDRVCDMEADRPDDVGSAAKPFRGL